MPYSKRAVIALGALCAVVGAHRVSLAQAVPQKPPVAAQRGATHDAVTEQELRKRVEATPKFEKVMVKKTRPVGDVHPAPESSLLTNSIFLFDGQMFTVVPVGAILNLPPAHRGHVIAKPQGEFLLWPDFMKNNASWLMAREVPLKMAKGDGDIAKAVLREVSTSSKVVVSVYKGGPITILEAPPEPAGTTKSPTADSDDKTSARQSKS